ncbi:MarC family protein [Pseudonocardia humida]|uniref:UPF0056 membrane protein n=1 Tax=Pseudonocardia humida TaxID=2800819 RepID=A0ABT1AB65_9PSEU|nr:MarC family protein [Pseudonocardia humida]MCO1659884.1 hypothetical protein [Pseudonocardia humida]
MTCPATRSDGRRRPRWTLFEQPLLLFLALFALYSPIAALPSYFPVVGRLGLGDQRRLAIGLFVNVVVFAMVALWLGEPLLELLGVSTAALTTTGGIALRYEGVALMRGTAEHPTVDPAELPKRPVDAPGAASVAQAETGVWRKYVLVPITFPLAVGGTTFAFFVAFRAEADSTLDVVGLSVAGLLYAAVTAIAVTILASGGTRLVVEVLEGLGR